MAGVADTHATNLVTSRALPGQARYHGSGRSGTGHDMSLEQAILEAIHALPPEKQREIFDYASRLRAETTKKPPFRTIEGLWDELGVALSAEEIEENRREMWSSFPRSDI
jgi:hypothetical protein